MVNRKLLKKCALILAFSVISSLSPTAQAAKTPRLKPVAGREDSVTNTILSGRGVPRASLGVEGDFYIDVTTFTIYGPKKASKWPTGVSLKGPQGEEGKSGERGAAGSSGNGAKGEKGDRGEKGEKGDKGETGERGATGAVGATGPAGSQGLTGAQGPAGPAGVAGSPGATGATGTQGAQGLQGPKGDTGDQGAVGPQGIQGIQGPKGDTGDQGVPGSQGPKGDMGPSAVRIVNVDSFTIGTSTSVEYRSAMFGAIEKDKKYSFEIMVTGKVSGPSGLGKYFGSYIEGSEAGLVITSSFSSSSGYLVTRSMTSEDAYQFRWTGTVTGSTNTAQLRLVMYHLNSSSTVSAVGTARFQEIGSLS